MLKTESAQGVGSQEAQPAQILVVDDDEKNLTAIEVALGDGLACRTSLVRSGQEALRALLVRDYAVILLDVQMPGLDGFETARLIRSRGRNRHVPIIFVTAFSQGEADIRRGYGLGAVDYLFKPIVEETLRAKVQMFVDLRERTLEVAAQAEKLRAAEREAARRQLAEERQRWEAEALRRQYDQLEESDRRKDQFIAMLAHELRNPLAPLVAGLELMREVETGDPLLARAREAMFRQVNHLVRLVDDLLDVSRISQDKLELEVQPVDARDVIQDAVEACSANPLARERTLRVQRPETPLIVRADRVRLTQVVQNLLNNAMRYTEPGGEILLSSSTAEGRALISVRDDGHGIDEALLERIFDIFVQARRGGQGLGLGLTLVKQLVEMHQGQVSAHSDGPGEGSVFEVRLPLCEGTQTVAAVASVEAEDRGPSLRIVLVEDEEDIRSMMCALLESWGHAVEAAATGPEGVTLVLESRPDVAVLDVGLPDLDGYGVARAICERMDESRPRLIAVTGYGQASDRERAVEAGFDAHIVKPAEPAKLRRALRGT